MPGRTPSDAFRAFIEPLQTAASCLGPVKITVSPGGRTAPDTDHAWTLNDMAGVTPGPGLLFDATMTYRIVKSADPAHGAWRVTTKEYRYRFADHGRDVFRFHWHPQGRSPVTYPHLHLPLPIEAMTSGEALKRHLPSPRMTFEGAVSWAVELGASPARPDWETVLQQCQAAHLQHRSWE